MKVVLIDALGEQEKTLGVIVHDQGGGRFFRFQLKKSQSRAIRIGGPERKV